MFVMFSPYSFLYFSSYLLFLFSLLQISNFYYYWAVMEIMMLLFMGLGYSVMVSSYSQLMVYFLIQTVASFLILVFFLYEISSMLTIAFILKLSMFPFFMWYINAIYSLPNFIFWLASTFHKIPPMVMIKVFALNLNYSVLWVSIFLTTFIVGLMMLSIYDLRMLLVLSSIGNNSWLILSQMSHFAVFTLYIIVYSFSLLFVLTSFGGLSKLQSSKSLSLKMSNFSFWILTLSGMPPFPLFYCKILVIITLFFALNINHFFMLFIFSSAFMFMSYLRSIMNYYVYVYASGLSYLLKY